MRPLFVSLVTLLLAASCSRATSDLTVTARTTFLLGEDSDYPYRASLRNTGPQTVTVVLRDKRSDTPAQTVTLAPGESGALDVSASQEVAIGNANDADARLYVQMSRSVQGMRYIDNDAVEEVAPTEPAPRTEARPSTPDLTLGAVPTAGETRVTLPQNQPYVLRETDTHYGVDIKVRRSGLRVLVREGATGRERESIAAERGTTWVHVRPGDELRLVATAPGVTEVELVVDLTVTGVPAEG